MRLRMTAIGTPAGAHRAAGLLAAHASPAAASLTHASALSHAATHASSAAICTIHKYFLP